MQNFVEKQVAFIAEQLEQVFSSYGLLYKGSYMKGLCVSSLNTYQIQFSGLCIGVGSGGARGAMAPPNIGYRPA